MLSETFRLIKAFLLISRNLKHEALKEILFSQQADKLNLPTANKSSTSGLDVFVH